MVARMADTSSAPATKSNENALAAVAYILTWITGLIVLLTAKKEEKFKRWHAVQAIALGVVYVVVAIIVNVLSMAVFTASGFAMWGLIVTLVWLLLIVLIIVMAVTAYQGKKVRLPVLAGFADKYA